MDDFQQDAEPEAVAVDTADDGADEDRFYDTLEDAAAALADDDEGEIAEEEAPEEPEAESEAEEPGGPLVTLSDGTKLSLDEVESGYLRQADYTRKTTEVAAERQRVSAYEAALTERAQTIDRASQRMVELVNMLIPPEPDAALARTNPAEYVHQKALRDQAMAEITGFLSVKDEAGQAVQALQAEQVQQQRQAENDQLVKAMPKLKDPTALAKFDAEVKAAAKGFGFDDAVIEATTDHRVRMAMYYAAIGQRAVANQQAAKRRVEAPKPGKPAQAVQPVNKNLKAMRRLAQTGSFKDAMSIDF